MTEQTSGPGTPPPQGAPPPPAGASLPPAVPKKKMSTGAKIAIALGIVMLLGMMAMAAVVVMGGLFLRDRASGFLAGMEEQEEATRILEDLEREVPFDPPADGVVTDDQAERFFATIETAWQEIEPWAAELRDLEAQMSGPENPSISEVLAGVQTAGRFVESRTVLAGALEESRMSSGEFIWTGLSLTRAYSRLNNSNEVTGVPPENLAVAERYRDEIAAIGNENEPGRAVILGLAAMWGMADDDTWQALGLDTLYGR
jgi:hypothetical protein